MNFPLTNVCSETAFLQISCDKDHSDRMEGARDTHSPTSCPSVPAITERRTAAAFSAVDKRKKEKPLMRISMAVSATYNFVYVMPQLFKLKTVRGNRLLIRFLKCLQLLPLVTTGATLCFVCQTGK
jgi:hypothetical protein